MEACSFCQMDTWRGGGIWSRVVSLPGKKGRFVAREAATVQLPV